MRKLIFFTVIGLWTRPVFAAGGTDGIQGWINNISSVVITIGITIAITAWIADYFWDIAFLTQLINKYKRGLVIALLTVTAFSFFEEEVKEKFSRLTNPSEFWQN